MRGSELTVVETAIHSAPVELLEDLEAVTIETKHFPALTSNLGRIPLVTFSYWSYKSLYW